MAQFTQGRDLSIFEHKAVVPTKDDKHIYEIGTEDFKHSI